MKRRKALRNSGLIVGGLITGPAIITLLQSCKNESRTSWQTQFFKPEEAKFISALVDVILPRTETPGALDVNVDIFIDRFIARAFDIEGQSRFRKDLSAFNSNCKNTSGKVFQKLSRKEQIEVLKEAEQASGKLSRGIWGKAVGKSEDVSFYRSLKAMAIWAFLSSEKIGKEVLSYDPIPGEYQGCIPLKDVGYKWSL